MSQVIDVRQEPGRVAVVLRPYAPWQALAFPGAQLAALLLVAAVGEPHSQQDRVVAALIAMAAGTVLGALVYGVAHLVAGREENVTVSGTQLVIDRQILRRPELRRRRAYAVSRISNLRAVGPVKPHRPWDAWLAFDHDGSTVGFGLGVAGSDADRVVNALAAEVPAWTAQEDARPSTAGALRGTSRGWSRVTLLVAALSSACLVAVALAWPPDRPTMTLAFPIAMISAAFIPMWAFIVFNAESRMLWRSGFWVRLLALVCGLGVGLVVPLLVMDWVSSELLSPLRSVSHDDLQTIVLVNMVLMLAGMFWMALRAEKRGWRMREERGVARITSSR